MKVYYCKDWIGKQNEFLGSRLLHLKHKEILWYWKQWLQYYILRAYHNACKMKHRHTSEELVWKLWQEDVVVATQRLGNTFLARGRYTEWLWLASPSHPRAELQQDEPALLVRVHSCAVSLVLEVPGCPKHCRAEICLWQLECHILSPLWTHTRGHTRFPQQTGFTRAGLFCFLPSARSHCPPPLPVLYISIFLLVTCHWR